MKIIASYCAIFFLHFQLLSIANAASENPDLKTCSDMQREDAAENELNCYRQVAKKPEAKKTLVSLRAQELAQEWEPTNAPLNVYKQTYALLYAHSSQPNNAPASPNPQNQVSTPSQLDNREIKFQISFKHDLANLGEYGSLWFGYTQLSFWQAYDRVNSRPFRENDYEPELIYSLRSSKGMPSIGLTPGILNFGLVHQSNGQSNPRSRSWNRVYIQPGLESDFGNDRKLAVLLRWWYRIKESPNNDDNPDITHFLGRGDIEIRYSHDRKWEISATGKAHSIQLGWAMQWPNRLLFPQIFRNHNTSLYFQYFSGYGESLIDYNQKHQTWGGGLTFPIE